MKTKKDHISTRHTAMERNDWAAEKKVVVPIFENDAVKIYRDGGVYIFETTDGKVKRFDSLNELKKDKNYSLLYNFVAE